MEVARRTPFDRNESVTMSILVLNAGSSTLKFALFDNAANQEIAAGMVDWQGHRGSASLRWNGPGRTEQSTAVRVADCGQAARLILETLRNDGGEDPPDPIKHVGYRVVHGGTEFTRATVIDEQVDRALHRISDLAPLHNPPALATIAAMRTALPDAVHVAVFDTAFFAHLPQAALLYPVPYRWFEEFGIRRFGFHGISHAYCAGRAEELLGRQNDRNLRVVVCHLGNGCSAAAIQGGQPLATSMGFTPLEGLMMGTRSGSIDPSILLYLLQQKGLSAKELEASLNRESGLLGVSGVSSDFREVEAAAEAGQARAALAIQMFADRVRSMIGAYAVTLGGIDALVFTAGIGQHSAILRRRVCEGLSCLGLHLEASRNAAAAIDSDISADHSTGRILVIGTREEQRIAQQIQTQTTPSA